MGEQHTRSSILIRNAGIGLLSPRLAANGTANSPRPFDENITRPASVKTLSMRFLRDSLIAMQHTHFSKHD